MTKVGDRFKDMTTGKVFVISIINEEGTVVLEGENGLGRRLTSWRSLRRTCEKVTAPMTGGMMTPPLAATDCMAAAKLALAPSFLIMGIVKLPTARTLDVLLPETIPQRQEAIVAVLPPGPLNRPMVARAAFTKKLPAPVVCNSLANIMNGNTMVPAADKATPQTPAELR